MQDFHNLYCRYPQSAYRNSPQVTQQSMIFKTFNSDIDKISAKWGIFGRSFNDIGTAITNKLIDFNDEFERSGKIASSWKNTDSIWKRLYPSKETIQSQMIDIEALFPKQTDEYFSSLLNGLTQQQNLINATKGSWTEYFKNLGEGEKWQIEFVQNTDLQKASLDDVKKAYEVARQGAIDHNAALKQQTLGAKAATIGMKALSIATNIALSMGVAFAIQEIIKLFDNLIHQVDNAKEALDEFNTTVKEGRDKLKSQSDFLNSDDIKAWEKLSKGVDQYGNSISLTSEQFDQYHSISNQIAEMFPEMVQGWDEQGNAILRCKGNIEELNKAYKESQDNFYQAILTSQKDVIKDYNTFTNGSILTDGNKVDIAAIQRFIDNGFIQASQGGDANSIIEGDYNIEKILDELGLDNIENDIMQQQELVRYLNTLINTQNSYYSSIKEIMTAYSHFASETSGLNTEASSIINKLINSTDYTFFDGKDYSDITIWIQRLIDTLKNNPDLSVSINDFINFDSDSVSEAAYKEEIENFIQKLKNMGLSEDIITQIKIAFEIDDSVNPEREKAIENLAKKSSDLTKELIEENFNKSEIDLMINGDIDVTNKTVEGLRKTIERKLEQETVKTTISLNDNSIPLTIPVW